MQQPSVNTWKTKQQLLEASVINYWKVSRQWNGHRNAEVINVSKANTMLRNITTDYRISVRVRNKAIALQDEITRNNLTLTNVR